MVEKLPELVSSRLQFLFLGMATGAFGPVIIFEIVNIHNTYTRWISIIGLFVGGAIGYFRGRKIDKRSGK